MGAKKMKFVFIFLLCCGFFLSTGVALDWIYRDGAMKANWVIFGGIFGIISGCVAATVVAEYDGFLEWLHKNKK